MDIELAIFDDCLILLKKFVESNSYNFKTFCEKWNEIMFQYIYAVQTTAYEVIQTTKAILYIAKRVICAKDEPGELATDNNEQQISRRIGGIYLMYAIYFKQPTRQYAKVLMTPENWEDLLSFVENLTVNGTADEVRYIFWKLYKEDAFRFTVNDYDLGLENLVDYDQLYLLHNGNKYVDSVGEKLKQKLVVVREAETSLPNMVTLEKEYNNSKESLLSTDKCAKPLPSTKIFRDIQDAIKSIHDILDAKDDESNSTPAKKINTSDRRKELKRKAAGYIINDDESPDDCQALGDTAVYYTAVRKFVTQELPEFINADLKSTSTDED